MSIYLNTNFGAREKAQRNILKNLSFRGHDLAHAVHGENVLRHQVLSLLYFDKTPIIPVTEAKTCDNSLCCATSSRNTSI
jgi:hypothetical protein